MKKFDFVIGNPPYHEETADTSDKPVYNIIMEAAQKAGEKVALITPARFLFDAGKTPKDFNKKMLSDPHFKVLDYAPNASKYFKNVDIKGGVAITLRDEDKNFGAIGTFTSFPELNSLNRKICVGNEHFLTFSEIVYSRTIYRLTEKVHKDFPRLSNRQSKGHLYNMSTNIFTLLPEIFFEEKPNDDYEYIQILGRIGTERIYKWIRRAYVNNPAPFEKFKIFVPDANGTGALGEVIPTPLVGSTETFISVGAFDTRAEADACLAYIKSKFCRAMLGILKVTQHNPPQTWAKVPMQDFNPATSDIDWSVPIPEIDQQLYRQYGLDDAEINFIETHVKAME